MSDVGCRGAQWAAQKAALEAGQTALGIEFGSTRIKAVLTDKKGAVLATGFYNWENTLVDGFWSYSQEEMISGMQASYASLKAEVERQYEHKLTKVGAIGISAMMHGIIALDKDRNFLLPFRTWRNTNTEVVAARLTRRCRFTIPIRWTISHLDQLALENHPGLSRLDYVATLAAYIHMLLTDRRVLGVGDASGVFPVDPKTNDYDAHMLKQVQELEEFRNYSWSLREVLPTVLVAGQDAGSLTSEGARLLDPSGELEAGIPLCPPEGDAGTGMVATNAVAPGTGNLSAGTSTFAMIVLKDKLSTFYKDIDIVATPSGYPVAMAHANNGSSDINAWVNIFAEFAELIGAQISKQELFTKLFEHSWTGDEDCGGIQSYGYYAAEPTVGVSEPYLRVARDVDATFTLANFMRSQIYGAFAVVRIGLKKLMQSEDISIDCINAHGGLFATPKIAQMYLADALDVPVSVLATANEGGAWGISLLAGYRIWGAPSVPSASGVSDTQGSTLEGYLKEQIFADLEQTTIEVCPEGREGFERYIRAYRQNNWKPRPTRGVPFFSRIEDAIGEPPYIKKD